MSGAQTRVLQLIGDFEQGGDGRVARNLALALRQDGMDANCIALRSKALGERGHPADAAMGIGAGLLTNLRGGWRLRRLLLEDRPDLIHVHGPSSLVFLQAVVRTLPKRPRVWFTWHDSGSVHGARRRSVRWAVAGCERVFGSSTEVASRLSVALGGRSVEVFRNGIPPLPITTAAADEVPTIAWAARIDPVKNPMALVRAAGRLHREGLRFRLVMGGAAGARTAWLADEIREYVQAHGLADVVSLPGWMSQVESLWTGAAIGVQTSGSEGLSMTLLEQAMSGLAIVATDVGDTSTVIEHERTGLLIARDDESALTDAIRRLLCDAPLRLRLGAAARELAIREFGLAALTRQVRDRFEAPPSTGTLPPTGQVRGPTDR